jgi:hypothetical protein
MASEVRKDVGVESPQETNERWHAHSENAAE